MGSIPHPTSVPNQVARSWKQECQTGSILFTSYQENESLNQVGNNAPEFKRTVIQRTNFMYWTTYFWILPLQAPEFTKSQQCNRHKSNHPLHGLLGLTLLPFWWEAWFLWVLTCYDQSWQQIARKKGCGNPIIKYIVGSWKLNVNQDSPVVLHLQTASWLKVP